MNSGSRLTLGMSALAASLLLVPEVLAQDNRYLTVTERPRPELDPLGVRVGSFLLFPKLGVTGYYDDNIFRTNTNTVDDFITVISPSVDLRSNWNNHALNLGARADIGRYADNGREDYEDYNLYANGVLDITRRARLSGGLSYSQLHEDRGSPDDANGVNPTEYSLMAANAAFRQQFNRLNATVTGNFRQFDYDNVRRANGTIVNNNARDRNEYDIGLRLGYEIVPAYEAFVRVVYNQRDYDQSVDANGFNRDSDGYETVAGLRVDLSGTAFGDVYAGYRTQSYDDSRLRRVSGLTYGAALTWNATALTTAKLSVAREVEETTQNNASGYFATVYGVSVDHELLRNLLIGGNAAYITNDYKGISREDDHTEFGLHAKYLWNRYLNLSLGYTRRSRDSSVAGADYDYNRLMLKVEAML